jgi:hypothetical protein
MILVNQQELPLTNATKEHLLYGYHKEYQRDLKALKDRFPKGLVRLRRMGWPKTNPTGMQEPTPRMVIPLQCTVEGENGQSTWAYCEGRAVQLQNGLRDLPDNKRSMMIGERIIVDLNKKPDLAVYLFKTKFIGKELMVDDPEGEALRAAMSRQSEIELATAIWNGIASTERLRLIAAAWKVPNAATAEDPVLRKALEDVVLLMEKEKQKYPENLSKKGIQDFLREIKADDDIRLKGIIQMSLDDNSMTLIKETGNLSLKGKKFLGVPFDYQAGRIVEFVASYLSNPQHKELLTIFLQNVLTQEGIKTMDEKGLIWLSKLFEVEHKGKASDVLAEDVIGKIGL